MPQGMNNMMDEMRTHYHYFSNEEGDGYEIYSCDYPDVKGYGDTYEDAMVDLRDNLAVYLKKNEVNKMEEESLLHTAVDAYNAKNYAAAKAIWEKMIDHNADAMVNLGTMYVKGYGVSRSMDTARELFEKAAGMGHEIASMYLGGMYENGIGVEVDASKAVEYYTGAAEGGVASAQLKLGLLLRNDDIFNSMKWMIKAAHAGEAQAQSLITYVSNHTEASDINVAFRRLDEDAQRTQIQSIIDNDLAPILGSDGGGVELVNYIGGETPEIWLRYLGTCSGCHLGSTSTAGMILEQFEKAIDKKIIIYLW